MINCIKSIVGWCKIVRYRKISESQVRQVLANLWSSFFVIFFSLFKNRRRMVEGFFWEGIELRFKYANEGLQSVKLLVDVVDFLLGNVRERIQEL